MKKKKIIVIICSVLAFAAIVAGAFFITKSINEKANISTAEFLASGHEWKKSGEETVVWTFESNGTCKVTTNSTETFDCKWEIEDKNLKIETDWLTTLKDEFEISINTSDNSFTAISKSDGKESTFVKKLAE